MTNFFIAGHALINKNGTYLIIRRSLENNYKPLLWDLPGGVMIPGESIEETILREVKEETNLDIKIQNVIHVYSNNDQLPGRQTIQIVFSCKYLGGNIKLNPREHDDSRWVAFSEISYVNSIEYLSNLLDEYSSTLFENKSM